MDVHTNRSHVPPHANVGAFGSSTQTDRKVALNLKLDTLECLWNAPDAAKARVSRTARENYKRVFRKKKAVY